MNISWTLPAPAKINLFLHIIKQRDDGYHELETAFQFLDWWDDLIFSPLQEKKINISMPNYDLPEKENMVYKSVQLLNKLYGNKKNYGIDIKIIKRLPLGAGLGGGSSNAATTLLALNQLWHLQLPITELLKLGQQLGADVPIFIHGRAAWATGVGEKLTTINPDEVCYVLVIPQCHVSTAKIFSDARLPRRRNPSNNPGKLPKIMSNDCLDIVCQHYPQVAEAYQILNEITPTYLTGTGACLFAYASNREQAGEIVQRLPSSLAYRICHSLNQSPSHNPLQAIKLR